MNITTTVDTDNDGKADTVQLRIKRPNTSHKVPTIIEPSIYYGVARKGLEKHPSTLLQDGTPAVLVPPAAASDTPATNPTDSYTAAPAWNGINTTADSYLDNYFVPRGYAVAELDALGTGHSQGCLGLGSAGEQAGVRAAIDWLNGKATGVYDGTQTTALASDWSDGKAALQGISYEGALAIEGAASQGINNYTDAAGKLLPGGLKTIVEQAGIADWYSYMRANGSVVGAAASGYAGWDVDNLASEYNNGPSACNIGASISPKLGRDTGDRNDTFWNTRNYTVGDTNKPDNVSVWVIQGMQDVTVRPDNSASYWDALQKWQVPSKLWITQDEHIAAYQDRPTEFLTQLHKWYDYYLLDQTDNGITNAPRVDVQSSDLTWTTQNSWPAPAVSPDGANVKLSAHLTGTSPVRTLTTTSTWAASRVDSMTMATGTDASGNPLANHDVLTNSDYMDLRSATLKYLTPNLANSVTLEGEPNFSVVAKTVGASPYLDALLVDFGDQTNTQVYSNTNGPSVCTQTVAPETINGVQESSNDPRVQAPGNTGCENMRGTGAPYPSSYRVLSRGWLDMRNYGGQPKSVNDSAQQVVPEDTYRVYDWKGEPMEATVAACHQIGLILLPGDTRNQPQYVGPNGDKATTLSIGTETSSVTLPVKSGAATLVNSPIVNGGFEACGLSGWNGIGASETVVNSGAHSGSYAARLGSTSATNGDSSIAQTFTAATGNTRLSFWYNLTCPDTVTYDWATATLKDNTANTTTTVLANTCAASPGWTQVSAAVTAGHSYTLTLTSHDDNVSGDPTYTLYDDVAVS
ncbi:CocE/NonD family hydrolase [Kitasatospora indigofera]|uniref:CocE/NonD family hydrolase n=1 Tax=Kitasatospora indigofera TaxID=67307 RepID=UPI00369A1E6C